MKIKPCPLCASPAKTIKYALVFWMVKCTQCMLKLKDMHTNEEAAIKAWGTRMTPQDRRNNSSKRWSQQAFFEIVASRTGEVLERWLEDDTDAAILVRYGFSWDCHDRAKDYGQVDRYSGKLAGPVELRYYDEVCNGR